MSLTIGEIFRAKLESLGAEEVRLKLSLRAWGAMERELAEEWLAHEEGKSERAAAARSESRSEESLSISRKALEISRSASRRALIAIMLSTTMAIYEIIKWYSSLN
jgi:hypothetical protein